MNLKISKKMGAMIASFAADQITQGEYGACAQLADKIVAQADGADKSGAVMIDADNDDITYLTDKSKERLPILDSVLAAATTDDERKPAFGEHSAWRALMRQIAPVEA